MKKIFPLIVLSALLFSCNRSKKEMLIKTWQAVKLENAQMDSALMQGQTFIDTVGKATDSSTNMALYGVTNMDSMRRELQLQLDSVKAMQLETLKNTVFKFRRDGVAILTFSGNTDSTKWYFDDQGAIMLDEIKEKGMGDRVKMEIVSLEDTLLKLKFTEKSPSGVVNSTVTFHPVDK